MKWRHETTVCEDRLIVSVLAFIWRLALKYHWIPLALYVPLLVADASVGLAAAYKLYNLWE